MRHRELPAGVAGDLSALADLSRAQLVEIWSSAHGRPPVKGISRRLLAYAAAYSMQVRAFGGLKPQTQRALRRIIDDVRSRAEGEPQIARSPVLNPGARLLREWHGQTHQVEVLSDGFVYEGERYRSLSAVARTITGARWSGPRFFGL